MNHGTLSVDHGLQEARDHRAVGAVPWLPWTEDIEITEPNCLQTIEVGKDLTIMLPRQLGGGVRRQRAGDFTFPFRKRRGTAIDTGAGRVDEPAHARVPSRE